jgi:hypothetical protein
MRTPTIPATASLAQNFFVLPALQTPHVASTKIALVTTMHLYRDAAPSQTRRAVTKQ